MDEHLLTTPVPAPLKKTKPVFLLVLCILTFVGSSISIVYDVGVYLTSNTNVKLREKAMSDLKEKLETIKTGDDAGKYVIDKTITGVDVISNPINQKKYALWSLIGNVLTLTGGIFMFNLKKVGFWIYVLGAILSSASAFWAFGFENIFAILTMTATAIVIFFGIVFIILYAINFKYLK